MAVSLNQVNIIGILCANPEFQEGQHAAALRVATAECSVDEATGAATERVEHHRVVVIGEQLVSQVRAHLRRGAPVFLQGRIQNRRWTDAAGADHHAAEIVLQGNGVFLLPLDIYAAGAVAGAKNQHPLLRSLDNLRAYNDSIDATARKMGAHYPEMMQDIWPYPKNDQAR
jgi:single-strand DNA-binding protein